MGQDTNASHPQTGHEAIDDSDYLHHLWVVSNQTLTNDITEGSFQNQFAAKTMQHARVHTHTHTHTARAPNLR